MEEPARTKHSGITGAVWAIEPALREYQSAGRFIRQANTPD